MLNWFKTIFAPKHAETRLQPEAQYVVKVNECGISCQHPSGIIESIGWKELDAVILETNDTGPWGMDVLWRLMRANGTCGCVIPQGATGEEKLLAKLQALPSFDNEQVIVAMSCADNQLFLCWRRAAVS